MIVSSVEISKRLYKIVKIFWAFQVFIRAGKKLLRNNNINSLGREDWKMARVTPTSAPFLPISCLCARFSHF